MKKEIKLDFLLIFIIILLFILIKTAYLPPPKMSDQIQYYGAARNFPDKSSLHPNHWNFRLGIILPTTLLYQVFGDAEITYYFVPLLSHCVFLSAIYWIGKILFSRSVGFLSAMIILFFPYIFFESADLLPDIPAEACFITAFAGLITVFLVNNSQIKNEKQKIFYLFTIGCLFGWAYLAREYYALFFILVPFFFYLFKIPLKHLFPLMLGMVLILGGELFINRLLYKDPFIRLTTTHPRETIGYIEQDAITVLSSFLRFLKKYQGQWFFSIIILAIIGGVRGIFRKEKISIFLFIWMLFIYFFLTTAGLLPIIFGWKDKVILRLHLFRYWIPIFSPLVLLGVATAVRFINNILNKIFSKNPEKNQITCILLIYSLSTIFILRSFFSANEVFTRNRNERGEYLELRSFLVENSEKVTKIWINKDGTRTLDKIIPIYLHDFWGKPVWDGEVKFLNEERIYLRPDEIQSGYVIIDTIYMQPDQYDVPSYLLNPPEHWNLFFRTSNHRIRVMKANTIE